MKIVKEPKIVLLLGAGASEPFELPTTKQFFEKIVQETIPEMELLHEIRKISGITDIEHVIKFIDTYTKFAELNLPFIKNQPLPSLLEGLTPEQLTTFTPLGIPEKLYKGQESLVRRLKTLRNSVIDYLFRVYSLNPNNVRKAIKIYKPFLELLFTKNAAYRLPVFTTNYDRVIEDIYGADFHRIYRMADGFLYDEVSREDRWASKTYEKDYDQSYIALFKLHGSLSWRISHEGNIVRIITEEKASDRKYPENVLIYPASEEYPRTEPFYTAYSYFQSYLERAEKCIVVGSSFRDDPINQRIDISMKENRKLKLIIVSPNPKELIKDRQEEIFKENMFEEVRNRVILLDGKFGDADLCKKLEDVLGDKKPMEVVKEKEGTKE